MKQKGGLFQLACFMPAETHEVSLFLSPHFMHETDASHDETEAT